MLDGVDARFKPHAHAFCALDVGGGRHAELVRLVDRRSCDFGRHAQNARLSFLLRIEDTSRDEQLHEVAFAREAVADDLARLLGSLCDVGEQPRAVAVRHRDADARSEQARPLVFPGVDRVAHVHIGKARVAHRAHGGHAARKLLLRMLFDDAPQVPHADRVSHHLVDKVARSTCARRLARAAKVHVQVHEAGRKVSSLKVDFLSVYRRHDFFRRTDRHDSALVVHDDGGVRARLHVSGAVEDGCMGENVGHGILLKRAAA